MSKRHLLPVCVLVIAVCLIALPVRERPSAQASEISTSQTFAQTATPTRQDGDPDSFPIGDIVNGLVLGLTALVTGGILWKLHQAASDTRAEMKRFLDTRYEALKEDLDKRYETWEKSIGAIQREREKLTEEQIELREQTWQLRREALEGLVETRQKQLDIKKLELEKAKDALNNTWEVLSQVINVDLRKLASPMQALVLRGLAPEVEMEARSVSERLAQGRVRALVQAQNQIYDVVESRVELDARDRLQWGNAHYQAGDYRRAVIEYMRAIEMAPDDFFAYISLGTAYEMLDDFDAAIEAFTTALGKESIKNLPAYEAIAFNNLGIVYYRTEQFEKAVESYSKAIELQEDYVDAYLNRSAAYEKLGRPQKAASDRKRVATLRANSQA